MKVCQILRAACSTFTIGRTILHSSTHHNFNRQQIRYISHPLKSSSKKIVTVNSTANKLIDELDKNKYPYIMLCNKQDSISGKMILHSDHDHGTSESKELNLPKIDEKDKE